MPEKPTHVIVGASLAGAKAAEALREEGFEGRIVLIGAEPDRPYERPPLSKEFIRGQSPREKAFVHRESFYTINPLVKALVARGIAPPRLRDPRDHGARSGQARRTPVGNGLDGDTFWIVAEHGRRAAYVRNIVADPRVRVNVRGRWRAGTAHLMPEDDPRERQRKIGLRFNAAVVRAMGTELLTVRVDLDPPARAAVARRRAGSG